MLHVIVGGSAPRWIATLILLALTLSTFSVAESAGLYKEKCSACHGANGAGETIFGRHLKLRSLASPEVQKSSDDELFAIISRGKNKMPAFDRKLSQDQIRDLVKHIRKLKQ